MSFTLTPAHLDSLLDPTRTGNLGPLFVAMDPACELRLGASDQPGDGGAGVYASEEADDGKTLELWKEKVMPWVMRVFGEGGLKFQITNKDIIGNKSIHEEVARAQMANGQLYLDRNCCIMHFSHETGKITHIRLYTDTEVWDAARRANREV